MIRGRGGNSDFTKRISLAPPSPSQLSGVAPDLGRAQSSPGHGGLSGLGPSNGPLFDSGQFMAAPGVLGPIGVKDVNQLPLAPPSPSQLSGVAPDLGRAQSSPGHGGLSGLGPSNGPLFDSGQFMAAPGVLGPIGVKDVNQLPPICVAANCGPSKDPHGYSSQLVPGGGVEPFGVKHFSQLSPDCVAASWGPSTGPLGYSDRLGRACVLEPGKKFSQLSLDDKVVVGVKEAVTEAEKRASRRKLGCGRHFDRPMHAIELYGYGFRDRDGFHPKQPIVPAEYRKVHGFVDPFSVEGDGPPPPPPPPPPIQGNAVILEDSISDGEEESPPSNAYDHIYNRITKEMGHDGFWLDGMYTA